MEIKNSPKLAKNYICEKCNYVCSKYSDYQKHKYTRKHIKSAFGNNMEIEKVAESDNFLLNLKCMNCNKLYKTYSGLWKHNKICNNDIHKDNTQTENSIINNTDNELDTSSNEIKILTNLVLEIVKTNTELQKQNQDFQKQMLEAYQNSNNTIINSNNNSHNKTFNLQVFLNEECKDAMNLKDFVNSFKLQLSDLELVGDEGFINGMTKVILAKLNLMDANTRPFHCTDLKRETIYVKEDDVWVREGPENSKLAAAIKAIGHQNFFILKEYKALHPDCESTYSEFNDHYMNLIMKSAGCQKEDIAKVIKKLVKEIVIIKQ
jgi:hypothetical protein